MFSTFLGVFEKLRIVAVSFIMFVCVELLHFHWTNFLEIWYLRIFQNLLRKADENLTRIMGTVHESLCKFMISCWIHFRIRNVSDKSYRGNQNIHFMFSKCFQKLCHVWDNVEKYGIARHSPDCNIIQRIHFTCCITKATDMHSEYAILIAFPQQQWLCKHASILTLYIACLFCNTGYPSHPEALPQYFYKSI